MKSTCYVFGQNGATELKQSESNSNCPVHEIDNDINVACGYDCFLFLRKDGNIMISKCETKSNNCQNSTFTRPKMVSPIGSKESHQKEGLKYIQVDTSYARNYALTSSGHVYSWLTEKQDTLRTKEIDDNYPLEDYIPRPILLGEMNGHHISLISAGHQHCLALSSGGRVFAWGRNNYGQLGIGQTSGAASEYVNEPKIVPFPDSTIVTKVSAGQYHSVALVNVTRNCNKTDTTIFGWGNSQFLGKVRSTKRCKINPQEILSVTDKIRAMEEPDGPQRDKKKNIQLSALSAGGFHTLALTKCGLVLAWGSGTYGQLGNGHTWDLTRHTMIVTQLRNVVQISAGLRHSLAIVQKPGESQRKLFGWGYNCNGELGLGSGDSDIRLQPYHITTIKGNCTSTAAGYRHSICIMSGEQ